VYDLDEIAARLAAGADYAGLTALIAADLEPSRLAPAAPAAAPALAVEPAPVAPGEALEIAALGRPVEVADPTWLPVPLPQVTAAAPVAAPVAAELKPAPARKATVTQAERIRQVVAAFRAGGVEPQPATVATVVGTDNISHVTRVMRKASTPAELEAAAQVSPETAEWLDRVLSDDEPPRELEDART
jgi:hypothetical protein